MDEDRSCHCPGPRYPTAFGRRSFIQVGLLGGMGLTLPEYFRAKAAAGDVRLAEQRRQPSRGQSEKYHSDHSARRLGRPGILGPQARSSHRIPRPAWRGEDQDPRRRFQRESVPYRTDRRQDHRRPFHHRPHPRSRAGYVSDVHRLPSHARPFSIPASARWCRKSSVRARTCRLTSPFPMCRYRAEPAISVRSSARSNWAPIPARRISRCAISRCRRG